MRPLQNWPIWMLQSIVAFRRRKSMWAEAYFELLERANDIATAYAKRRRNAYVVVACGGIN